MVKCIMAHRVFVMWGVTVCYDIKIVLFLCAVVFYAVFLS